ncbi:YhdP family protein [Castellaniella sp.]|uniref:YhdP family protein n=1 Tax=Castellaniella sp. TaxID=1955812 RepID=UPI002AFE9DD5|nr:YhdP family protein [Castellaniella sp.]
MRQFISKLSCVWPRRICAVLLCLYFGLAGLLLAGRYLILPHLDDWRPQIAARLSQAAGAQVSLGSIQVSWHGWNPQFDLRQVRVSDDQGHDWLAAPSVRASLNWAALLPGRQGVLRLQVQGMDLGLARLPDGRLRLLGQVLGVDRATDQATVPGWLQWVLAQPLIAFQDATVHWDDQLRGAPELVLRDAHVVLRRQGADEWGLSLSARAPLAGDARLDIRVVADAAALMRGRAADWRGWLQLSGAGARDWRPWVDLPQALEQGRLDAQFWARAGQRSPELTLLLGLQAVRWGSPDAGPLQVQVPQAELWLQGGLDQWQALAQGGDAPNGLAFDLRTQDIRLTQPQWFEAPLAFGAVAVRGSVQHAGRWALELQRLDWRNADIALQGAGRWDSGGLAGTADFQGTIARARLDAIHRYLPLEVDADAREWLSKGLQAGTLFNGQWVLRGDLADFPFGEKPQAGDFQVRGDFRDARIEFVPDAPKGQSWPLLQDMIGTADLHRMDLRLSASTARMEPAPGQEIRLSGLRARIPDLEHDATLQVSGHSAADGETYMNLIRQTPLAHLLDGVFDEASAAGDWQVPLALTIPLLRTDDSQVQGRIDLQQGRLQFLPQAPPFEAIDGSLHFSEQGVQIAHPLTATILGGAVRVQGALGGAQAAGLSLQGHMTAKALAAFVGVPGMKRLSGALDYRAQLAQQGGAYVFNLDSDTRGLGLDFPAPLAKPVEQARSLQVHWTDADEQADILDVRLGDLVVVGLRHVRRMRQGPYFQQALVGVGQAADPAEPGLRLALRYPLIDLDLWNRIVDEFSIPRRGRAARAAARPLWPDLSLLSVQADQLRLQLTRLDHAVLRVTRTPDEQWSLNLRSEQTTGTLKWRELDGRVQGPLSGRFARLSLGDDPRDTQSLLPADPAADAASFEDDLEIPGLILQADDLRLYGRAMGALSLEGVRDNAHHVWQMNHLRIGDEDARLQGSGAWRLRGPDRGLSLQATVKAQDLGAWLSRAGWPGMLSGGQGTLKGDFTWRDLPWRHDKADLSGSLQIELDKGRILKVASQTGKLLEILSLQSIARLNHLDQGLAGLPKDGFPFDQLRGSLSLSRGVVQAHDYKLIGSVGTVLLEGSTNILDKSLNMQAVIVPNLDVSGAALAAGIAINPLIGLGAFVTQWLLKTPLAKAMTVRYQVKGTWSEPKITEVPIDAATQEANGK